MAFDKAKVLKAAEKFLSQGKINAAIKEYRQLVDNDENDLTALNMLGDLCVRAEKTEEAISCFQRIAEHYAEQEFTLKAIAMYKKIDRLKPRDPYIAHKLGNLYAAEGLIVDARAQFLVVADAYTRAGQTKKALDIFHNIADLDPLNTEIRLKLAEGYLKENMKAEAAEAFADAGRHFYDTGLFEKSLDSFNKALQLEPGKNSILSGIVAAHAALGSADEAVELLERAVEAHPEDVDLVQTLLTACLEAEDPKAAERATAILLGQNPSDYTQLIAIAHLYLKLGEVDEATRVLTGIVEQMLAGRDEKELLEIVNEVLVRNPEHVPALRLLVRVHWWQRDMDALRVDLERMAEAAESAGLVEDERYALTQLLRLVPDEQKFADRLKEIGGATEDIAEEPLIPSDGFAEVSQFETFEASEIETTGSGDQKRQFEWEVVTSEGQHDPATSFADLSETFERSGISLQEEFETNQASEGSFNPTAEVQESVPPVHVDDPARREAMMRQELESVDFYLAQGYSDIAGDTLQMLERQFGPHPDIQSRKDILKNAAAAPAASSSDVFEFGHVHDSGAEDAGATSGFTQEPAYIQAQQPTITAEPAIPAGRSANVAAPPGPALDAGLAEIFEEFKAAAEEEQLASHEDYETHYNMGTAYKEMDLLDDAIHEFQTAAGLVSPNDGTSRYLQCCNLLGHCFIQKDMPRAAAIWFQKALDAGGHNDEERKALIYELASAYESMGEINRAVDLYTEVYGIDVGYREVEQKIQALGSDKQKSKGRKKKH